MIPVHERGHYRPRAGRAASLFAVVLMVVTGCRASTTIESSTSPFDDTVGQTSVETDTQTEAASEPELEPTVAPAPTPAPEPDAEPPAASAEQTSEDVNAAFEDYRDALVALDGAAAAEHVTPSTIEYYGELLDLGLTATADDLLGPISLSDGLGVLSMRGRFGDELLAVDDGAQLFRMGVDAGLVGSDIATTQIQSFEIEGNEAFGSQFGVEIMRFEFIDGNWLFDIPFTTAVLDDDEQLFVEALAGQGATRAELYEVVALGLGTTWDELSQPIG